MTRIRMAILLSALLASASAAATGARHSPSASEASDTDATELRLERHATQMLRGEVTLASCRPLTFTAQRDRSDEDWGPVVADIARHLPARERYEDAFRRYIAAGDLVTAAHEWTHFLNEYLTLQSGVGRSAYYVLNDRYIVLEDPEGLRGIVPHVPRSLRGDLHELYLVHNGGNARIDPLYLFDEWVAYANDLAAAIAQLEAGKPLYTNDRRAIQSATAGNVLEFTFYGLAVGHAVQRYDRAYYEGLAGAKLRAFIIWHAQRSLDLYERALRLHALSRGDERHVTLLRAFNHAPDAAQLRMWVRTELGEALAERLMPPGPLRLSRADGIE